MQKRAIIFLLCLITAFTVNAQLYLVELPKQKKNEFAKGLVKLLNDAPTVFKESKDKPVKGGDSNYLHLTVLHNKVRLKGATTGKVVLDSIPFVEYFFGKFAKLEDAEAAHVNLSNQIAEALMNKVLFKNEDGNAKGSLLKQTKIAYTQNSGFFLYNMMVQMHLNTVDSSYTLLFKITSGRPAYFYKIPRNEPVSSFMFVSALKSQLPAFQKQRAQGCLGNLTPFVCKGTKRSGDTLVVVYTKQGFTDLPDAKKEFEATLSNMRVCLSDDYVYYLPNITGDKLREVCFLRFDDIEKKNPRVLKLTLIELSSQEYALELGFVYK